MLFKITLFISATSTSVFSKECTNTPTYLSSHTLRFELQSSKQQLPHDHLIPTDDSAWSQLLPRRKILKEKAEEELNWAMLYRKIKNSGSGGSMASWVSGDFLKEVPLFDVQLKSDSMHWRAQQTNLEYLLMLDVDSLVWSFRKTAGLETPGSPYGGWEDPACELRGHFVGWFLFFNFLVTALLSSSKLGVGVLGCVLFLVVGLFICLGNLPAVFDGNGNELLGFTSFVKF